MQSLILGGLGNKSNNYNKRLSGYQESAEELNTSSEASGGAHKNFMLHASARQRIGDSSINERDSDESSGDYDMTNQNQNQAKFEVFNLEWPETLQPKVWSEEELVAMQENKNNYPQALDKLKAEAHLIFEKQQKELEALYKTN